jgi:hypothetical protein
MILRRAVLAATCLSAIPAVLSRGIATALAGEVDMFAYMLRKLGEPRFAAKISDEEAGRYAGRVPDALIRFWSEHGRGAYLDGLYWICDPAPFDPLLALIFAGDAELDPAEMTVVAHTAFGSLKLWHRRRRSMLVDLLVSTVFNQSERAWHDAKTGQPFSENFGVGTTVAITGSEYLPEEKELLAAAAARLGPLEPGEVYGFFPALQLGGAYKVENLRRVKAPEHFAFLAQLQRFDLVRLTEPEPPAYPYGRTVAVRKIGPAEP